MKISNVHTCATCDPIHFIFDSGGRLIEWRYLRFHGFYQIKYDSRPQSWKIQMAIYPHESCDLGWAGIEWTLDILPMKPNPKGGRTPSGKISNEYICSMVGFR